MRAHDKRKFYKLFIRRQVQKGLVASASTGTWGSAANTPESMLASLRAGYRVKARS